MASKSYIRSMRFSPEMVEIIESQIGNSFSEKFENLVSRCRLELPEKERQLAQLDQMIAKKRNEYSRLSADAQLYLQKLDKIQLALLQMSHALDQKADM